MTMGPVPATGPVGAHTHSRSVQPQASPRNIHCPPNMVLLPPCPPRPPLPTQPNRPDPHQDRPATGADAPSRTGRLLTLVRTLIDYGRHLAAALQQRTSATDLADITRHFGIVDIGEILARITRGLLRAAALEARLVSHPVREPATGHPDRPIPSPAARRPTRGRKRRRGRTTHRPSAHARGHRGRDPPPPGRRRPRRYLSRPRDRAEQPAVAGTLPGHHQLRRQSRRPGQGHRRSARPVADPSARRRASRGTGTDTCHPR